jgi:hypothetical protein
MKIRRLVMASILAILAIPLLPGVPAMADPPSTNPNMIVWHYACNRGSETLAFQAGSISQNQALALQLLDGTAVVHNVHAELLNGQVVFDIPGQSGRPDLWSCTIAEVPGVVVDVFLTPRG